MNNPEFIDSMERFIDSNSLQEALQLLSTICWEKATHALTNWQDKKTATSWEHAAIAIDTLSIKPAILTVSSF